MTTDINTEDRVEVDQKYQTYGFSLSGRYLSLTYDYGYTDSFCSSCIHSVPNKRRYKDKPKYKVCKYDFLPHPEVGCLAYQYAPAVLVGHYDGAFCRVGRENVYSHREADGVLRYRHRPRESGKLAILAAPLCLCPATRMVFMQWGTGYVERG